MKLKVDVWGHGRAGVCVQSRVLLTVPSKASSWGASTGQSNPEEEKKLSQGLEKVTESSQVPGVEALGQCGLGAAQVLGLGSGERTKSHKLGPLYPPCTDGKMEAQRQQAACSGPQG